MSQYFSALFRRRPNDGWFRVGQYDATTVDTAKFPKRAGDAGATQFCDNCQLYQGGDEWGPCSIFPGKAVAAKGWCNAWVPKQG